MIGWRRRLGFQAAYRNIFKDAVFGFSQARNDTVRGHLPAWVTSRLSSVDIPGKINDPIHIITDDADFGRHRRHLAQAAPLLSGPPYAHLPVS